MYSTLHVGSIGTKHALFFLLTLARVACIPDGVGLYGNVSTACAGLPVIGDNIYIPNLHDQR
jgi:hypothetical protein